MSMLLDVARRYLRRGWMPVYVPPGVKGPTQKEWQKQRLTEADLSLHFDRPGNIGLILGEASGGLTDVDLDCPEASDLADQYLPATPAVTGRPSSPRSHRWYISDVPATQQFRDPKTKKMIIELRSTGGQTLVGPSIHESGEPYDPLEGEPACVPEQMLEACVKALYEAVVRKRYREKPKGHPVTPPLTATRPREINPDALERRALAYLEAMPSAISGNGGHSATYAAATALVHGFGLQTDRALHLLLAHYNPRCEPPWSEKELRHKVEDAASKPHKRPLGWLLDENTNPEEGVDLSGILTHHDIDADADPTPASPGPLPAHFLEQTPDIVRQAMDYYTSLAVETQPVLFLGSIIAATGTVLGQKVKDASGLRTNIYTLGITPSGGGKEATREVVRRIFRHAGIASVCGPEDFASDAGLISAVCQQNPIIFQLDEFGRLMHSVNQGRTRSPHLYNIASILLKFYSKAGSVFRSKAYADPKRNREIDQPHVCIYGTSISANFWRSMDADSLDGGFLPRLLIFESKNDAEPGKATESDPPDEVVRFFRYWADYNPTGGNLNKEHPNPMVVPYSDEATVLMNDFRNLQKTEQKKHEHLGVLWSRARENAGKLALIHACWRQPVTPVVEEEDAQWAIDLTTHLVRHSVYEANLCLSEGAFHERCQKILRALEKAPNRNLTKRQLTRATRNMTPREREEAVITLAEQERLGVRQEATGGRPRVCYWAL